MKTHFTNRAVPPVTAAQLRSVGVDPSHLYWSGTFQSWMFRGPLANTGATLARLGLTPDPEA